MPADRTRKSHNGQYKQVMVTIHLPRLNKEDAELNCEPVLQGLFFDTFNEEPSILWMAGQLEKAPTTGMLHWQLTAYATKRGRRTWWQRVLSPLSMGDSTKIYVEPARGNVQQRRDYVTKEDTRVYGPYEYGNAPAERRGKRTDLEEVAAAITSGQRMDQVALAYPVQFVRYHKGMNALQEIVQSTKYQEPRTKRYTVYIWGPSGAGKSTAAQNILEELGVPWQSVINPGSGRSLWLQGFYPWTEAMWLDDMRVRMESKEAGVELPQLLDLLGDQNKMFEKKNGHVRWMGKYNIITTIKSPQTIPLPVLEDRHQLERRLNCVIEISHDDGIRRCSWGGWEPSSAEEAKLRDAVERGMERWTQGDIQMSEPDALNSGGAGSPLLSPEPPVEVIPETPEEAMPGYVPSHDLLAPDDEEVADSDSNPDIADAAGGDWSDFLDYGPPGNYDVNGDPLADSDGELAMVTPGANEAYLRALSRYADIEAESEGGESSDW